ncbi:GlyGly-CTERM sorting domain-containing protein [Paenibacillus sp. ClWae2A]
MPASGFPVSIWGLLGLPSLWILRRQRQRII